MNPAAPIDICAAALVAGGFFLFAAALLVGISLGMLGGFLFIQQFLGGAAASLNMAQAADYAGLGAFAIG